jgi:hypothetical protein
VAESFLYSTVLLLEEGEVNTAILTVLHKSGMLAEVMILAVFNNQ